jgi:hypothetical protein
MNGGGLRMHFRKLPVFGDRTFQIARLLLLDCILNKFLKLLGSLCLCDRADTQDDAKKCRFPHAAAGPNSVYKEKRDGQSHPVFHVEVILAA